MVFSSSPVGGVVVAFAEMFRQKMRRGGREEGRKEAGPSGVSGTSDGGNLSLRGSPPMGSSLISGMELIEPVLDGRAKPRR